MLELSGITSFYGASQALFGVSLQIREAEVVTLLGRNGMGKSTTIRSIMGLTPARTGTIRYRGTEIQGLPSYRIARMGIGLVPEGRQIFPNLTVRENLIATAANYRGSAQPYSLADILDIFPRLAVRLTNYGNQLSGGEQQMLAVGRALMSRARLLLLDEPSMGLAPLLVREIFRVIQRINQQGAAILLVEQNAHLALEVAHRAYILETGEIALSGPASELRRHPQVLAAYLGGA